MLDTASELDRTTLQIRAAMILSHEFKTGDGEIFRRQRWRWQELADLNAGGLAT